MCGRYHIDEETINEIKKIAKNIDMNLNNTNRDIYPSNSAPVMTGMNQEITLHSFKWGFPGFNSPRLIINARAETLLEKKSFKASAQTKRILIPSKHYYEWDEGKTKFTFCRDDKKPMYFAGIYNTFDGTDQFVIITTSANDSVRPVHSRMPLIIEDCDIYSWLFDSDTTEYILNKIPTPLLSTTDYTQLKLNL